MIIIKLFRKDNLVRCNITLVEALFLLPNSMLVLESSVPSCSFNLLFQKISANNLERMANFLLPCLGKYHVG